MSKASLQFASDVSARANEAWANGQFLEAVTPTTRELLTYWFSEGHTTIREINYHEGQRQAILNTIYLHEVVKAPNIFEAYQSVSPDLLLDKGTDLSALKKDKYAHPKYCIKMATGTGKTWVLSALLIWQYLNAKHSEEGNFTKNFLIVAPGLIVYERLLDAFVGKERDTGEGRNFESSDMYAMRELFLPEQYQPEVFGFLQSSVVAKSEIGKKSTGSGMVAITNWHLLAGAEEEMDADITESAADIRPDVILQGIPRPGKSTGNDLDVLDAPSGGEVLQYLRSVPDLMVFNDEAHHIHEVKKNGQVLEVEWQKSLVYIAETKLDRFVQVDFSATPYNQVGKDKVYFPHIIVNFELKTAIQKGFVKTLVLDRRKEIAAMELDFKAERDEEGKVIGISEGQRVMLRAGLKKLSILEESFMRVSLEKKKYPKMLIVCEDTNVVPFVAEFLLGEGLGEEDVLEIHSNKKGEVGAEEWLEIKHRLFHLDHHETPRVVISVLMLREGFDVNNICVIVPLRSSQSGILLEQTIGRGLRLMWREPEFQDEKEENRHRLLVQKTSPKNYFDLLSIVEHPAFLGFYDELMKEGLIGTDDQDIESGEVVTGDIITVGLRQGYEKFDFQFPIVIREPEEILKTPKLSVNDMAVLDWPSLPQLKKMVGKGEAFVSEEATQGTRFGDYNIHGGVMSATNYNDYVSRLVNRVSILLREPITKKAHSLSKTRYPALQVNLAVFAEVIDGYIRSRLFKETFNPFEDDNWKVLITEHVSTHIIKEVASAILKMQETEVLDTSEVLYRATSEVNQLRMREDYAIDTAKTIYAKTAYPSSKGGLEKDFIEFADQSSSVEAFVKLFPYAHNFVRLRYIKDDGLAAYYYPDFLVRCTNGKIYMVETKSEDQINHPNVQRKHSSALFWVDKVNKLPPEKRSGAEWNYVLLGEAFFGDWKKRGASMEEILEFAKLRPKQTAGGLF
jgi:type III restriction enzyme